MRDIRVERSEMKGGARKKDYVLCGVTNRNWNAAPAFGFASETLYMTEDSRYTFGTDSCEQGSSIRLLRTRSLQGKRNLDTFRYFRNVCSLAKFWNGSHCLLGVCQGHLRF